MRAGTRGEAGSRLLAVGEGALWTTVVLGAIYAASVGPTGGGAAPGEQAYRFAYFVDAVLFSLLLAGILIAPFRRPPDARPRLAAVALPAFLVALLLHIAVWGVSASRWLSRQQPELGASLWAFATLARPLGFALAATFGLKLRIRGPGRPSRTPPWAAWWFPALSAVFLALLGITAVGAYLTARDVRGDWFGGGIAPWGLGAVAVSAPLLAFALIACARMDARAPPGTPADASLAPRRSFPWRVVLGPLAAAALLAAVSLLGLGVPAVAADPRLNTGLVLFASYGGALFPSYAVVAALRLLAPSTSRRTTADPGP